MSSTSESTQEVLNAAMEVQKELRQLLELALIRSHEADQLKSVVVQLMERATKAEAKLDAADALIRQQAEDIAQHKLRWETGIRNVNLWFQTHGALHVAARDFVRQYPWQDGPEIQLLKEAIK